MRGIKDFNFPAFARAAAQLCAEGHEVFNPAERDEAVYGTDFAKSETGNLADIAATGFSIREALAADCARICSDTDGIALLPGWSNSKGACAEKALGEALGLEIRFLPADVPYA
jgi:hypothetical protein